MRKVLSFLLALPLVAAAADYEWRGGLGAGKRVEIKGVNGSVTAELAPGGQVEVVAKKSARRSDPNSVEIRMVESADGLTFCAVYPSEDWFGRQNTCEAGKGGRNSVRDNDVKVDFFVKIPAGVRFHGHNVNGDVTALGMRSDLDLATVNGRVRGSTTGTAAASTVNGGIEVEMGQVSWNGMRNFSTVNGSIELTLPSSTSTEVRATTVNGSISSDFPLTVEGKFMGRQINGRIGNGGREMNLKTVNGSIRLRRSGKVA